MAYRVRFAPWLKIAALLTLCVPPPEAASQTAGSQSPVVAPLAGSGSGGAHGPSVIDSLFSLRGQSASSTGRAVAPAPRYATTDHVTVVPPAGLAVHSTDATVDLTDASDNSPRPAPTREGSASASGFSSYSTQDVAGASDGRYITSTSADGVVIHTISGSIVKSITHASFRCSGSNPPSSCSLGGFPGDQRYYYDERRGRWITTALWVFSSSPVPLDVMAVSQGGDPTAGWFVYEFPACGGNYNGGTDKSDQPHSGFNNQWTRVNH